MGFDYPIKECFDVASDLCGFIGAYGFSCASTFYGLKYALAVMLLRYINVLWFGVLYVLNIATYGMFFDISQYNLLKYDFSGLEI